MGYLTIFIFALFVVVGEVSSHDCTFFHCDPETGLRKETLISATVSYEVTSQCVDPTHCDDSTPGTGHKLSSELTDDLIAVERCYSYCYTNVRVAPKEPPLARYHCLKWLHKPASLLSVYIRCSAIAVSSRASLQVTGGIPEGATTLIDNIYAEPACSDKWMEVGHRACTTTGSAVHVKCLVTSRPLILFPAGPCLFLRLYLWFGVAVDLEWTHCFPHLRSKHNLQWFLQHFCT